LPDERTMEDLEKENEELQQKERELCQTFFTFDSNYRELMREYQGCQAQVKKMKPLSINAARLLAKMTERCKSMELDVPEGSQTPPTRRKRAENLEGNRGEKGIIEGNSISISGI